MAIVGVDGCKGGWFAIRREQEAPSKYKMFASIDELWNEWRDASLILIDIPIGLPKSKTIRRECDVEARRHLGQPRGSSVFPTPGREALRALTYPAAKDANQSEIGKKLSKQTWAIIPKIKEVDDLLRGRAQARSRIREVHPELCFWAFAGEPMKYRKGKQAGYQERLSLLRGLDPSAECITNGALKVFPRKKVAKDDILDALVAALTAECGVDRLGSVSHEPQCDEYGLPMEMLYCLTEQSHAEQQHEHRPCHQP